MSEEVTNLIAASQTIITEAAELLPLESIDYAPEHDYIAHLSEKLTAALILLERSTTETREAEWEFGYRHVQGTVPCRSLDEAVARFDEGLRHDERRQSAVQGRGRVVRRVRAGEWEVIGTATVPVVSDVAEDTPSEDVLASQRLRIIERTNDRLLDQLRGDDPDPARYGVTPTPEAEPWKSHEWPCPLFYVGNWTRDKQSPRGLINCACGVSPKAGA